jgi:hypothetical protein
MKTDPKDKKADPEKDEKANAEPEHQEYEDTRDTLKDDAESEVEKDDDYFEK